VFSRRDFVRIVGFPFVLKIESPESVEAKRLGQASPFVVWSSTPISIVLAGPVTVHGSVRAPPPGEGLGEGRRVEKVFFAASKHRSARHSYTYALR
jgi:hypothetical protein